MLRKLLCVFVLSSVATCVAGAQNAKTYIILAKTTGKSSTANFAANLGSSLVARYDEAGIVVAQSSDPDFANWASRQAGVGEVAEDQLINWLPNESAIQMNEADMSTSSIGANQEPGSALQWNLRQLHADQTAANGDRGNGAVRARVAILDDGIVKDHPDIAPNLNLALSKSFVPTEPDLNPPAGAFSHGTHVAGIVAAPINRIGVQGVAPEAELVAVKVLNASGAGSFAWLIAGIEYASGPDVRADVINMSLGASFDRKNAGGGGAGPLISALNRAVNHAEQRGTLVVSAAGNDGVDLNGRLWEIPAQSGHGMAVSATGPLDFAILGNNATFDRLASYSNYGQSVINVAAPGGDLDPALKNSNCTIGNTPCYVFDFVISPGGYAINKAGNVIFLYYFAAGTSMAAPHVSGEAALIVGKYGHMNPSILRSIIENSADNIGRNAFFGRGRINALSALQ